MVCDASLVQRNAALHQGSQVGHTQLVKVSCLGGLLLTCLLGQDGPRLDHELLEDGLERLILLPQLVDQGTRLRLFLMVLRPRLRLLLLHHLHHGLLVLLVRLWAG